MIAAFVIAADTLAALVLAAAIIAAALGVRALASQWRAASAVIEQTRDELYDAAVPYWPADDFDDHAAQAIAVTGLWSDEDKEILLGRRPLQ